LNDKIEKQIIQKKNPKYKIAIIRMRVKIKLKNKIKGNNKVSL
jgi:hypothetical protein